jgi:hypothetical protein
MFSDAAFTTQLDLLLDIFPLDTGRLLATHPSLGVVKSSSFSGLSGMRI